MVTRLQKLLLVVSVAVVITGCDNTEPTDQSKTLRIGTTGQSFPGSYKEDGKLVGYDVEVAENIAHELGYSIEWTTSDFSGLMGQLEAGKLDTIANNFVQTDARQKKYNFSTPYLTYSSQIVTSTKNDGIQSLSDLNGKTIAGVLGSTHVTNLRNAFPPNSITIRTYETRDGAVNDVITNRVQGYINSRPILLAEINKHKLPLKLVGEPLSHENVSFPFAKDAKGDALLTRFNETLNTLRNNGKLSILAEKYFGNDDVLPTSSNAK
ncbi:ABC transporter substrate-binding protein [Pectobacterium cacticida]